MSESGPQFQTPLDSTPGDEPTQNAADAWGREGQPLEGPLPLATPKRAQAGQRRQKAEFSDEELSQPLPSNEEEFRRAIEALQNDRLQKRTKKGDKFLSRAEVQEYMDIKRGNIECKDAGKKFRATHNFGVRQDRLVKMTTPPGAKKATKDNQTVVAGVVVATEDWFDVAYEAHNSLHGARSSGRDATMNRIHLNGYYASIPKDFIQGFVDRCPHPSCRESSRLAKAQQQQQQGQASTARAARASPCETAKARRQAKLDHRRRQA